MAIPPTKTIAAISAALLTVTALAGCGNDTTRDSAPSASSTTSSADTTDPRGMAQNLLNALSKGDMAAAVACYEPDTKLDTAKDTTGAKTAKKITDIKIGKDDGRKVTYTYKQDGKQHTGRIYYVKKNGTAYATVGGLATVSRVKLDGRTSAYTMAVIPGTHHITGEKLDGTPIDETITLMPGHRYDEKSGAQVEQVDITEQDLDDIKPLAGKALAETDLCPALVSVMRLSSEDIQSQTTQQCEDWVKANGGTYATDTSGLTYDSSSAGYRIELKGTAVTLRADIVNDGTTNGGTCYDDGGLYPTCIAYRFDTTKMVDPLSFDVTGVDEKTGKITELTIDDDMETLVNALYS